MSLKNLNNQELIASTKRALQVSREAEVDVLRHFREIEDRRLWAEAGSLYKFIEITFELTADQIYPRLQAMRVMRVVPEVEEKLEQGELSVTNVLKAHQVNLVQFYADDETIKEIEDLKAKYSHQMPSGKLEHLIKILIQNEKREAKPRKRVTIKTRARHISAEVKREMEKTRHEGCAHVDSQTGERCGSKHFLQLDHILEYSRGGSNEAENLQWLCGSHNRFRFKTRSAAARNCGRDSCRSWAAQEHDAHLLDSADARAQFNFNLYGSSSRRIYSAPILTERLRAGLAALS